MFPSFPLIKGAGIGLDSTTTAPLKSLMNEFSDAGRLLRTSAPPLPLLLRRPMGGVADLGSATGRRFPRDCLISLPKGFLDFWMKSFETTKQKL